MENVIRNVRDIDTVDRRALEHVIGQHLFDDQQIVIKVVRGDIESSPDRQGERAALGDLPDWCNVYEGLDDNQIAEIDRATSHRLDLTHTAE